MALTIGILGYGSIGKRHAANAGRLGHRTLVYDPALPIAPSRGSVLANSDAIIIATPTTEHWQDIMDCAEMGKPMLIEKPITHPDLQTLEKVAYALGTSGVPAFMGFNLRFHACVQEAKEWIPRIGKPLQADFSVLQKCDRPDYHRDGVISNWLSHEIDLALYLLGPGVVESCHTDIPDSTAELILKHGDCTSTLKGDYHTDPEVRRFIIVGEDGDMVVRLRSREFTCIVYTNNVSIENFKATDTFNQNYEAELSSWIKQIKGDHGLCATWEDGVAVERIVIKARELGGLT